MNAPPIGQEIAPPEGSPGVDPVAVAAQAAYEAFVPWRQALDARASARDAVREADADVDATPDRRSAAGDSVVVAQAALSVVAPPYRAARDALADAVVVRAGRPIADGVRLSAIWERADPKRLAVVLVALTDVGEPYVFGMSGPDQFDCSGLTRAAWLTAGVDLVHYAVTQRQQTLDVAADALQPGDLVFRFRHPGGHVMLYLGVDDLVVQAGGVATGVVVSPWGNVDAMGSPLALAPAAAVGPAAVSDPEAPLPPVTPSLFGRAARGRTVGDDIPLDDAFNAAGARYQVAPVLLAAIASVTSGYRAPVDMGLRPAIIAGLRLDDDDDPLVVVDAAAERLVELYLLLGDERTALAAYVSSLGTVSDVTAVPDDPATKAFVEAVEAVVQASTP